MGIPCPPPSGQSKCEMGRFTLRFVHVATLTQCTSLQEALQACSENTKHSNVLLSRDSSMAAPQIQRLIPKERGSEK